MIDPTVRAAEPHDTAQLTLLEAEARDLLYDARGGTRWLATHPQRRDDWQSVLDSMSDHRRVFVAHIEPVVVGYLVATVAADVAVIDEVFVTPGARELGFGDALLERAIGFARAAGASVLEGEALPGDRNTKNLYERAGIKARLITVSAPI